MPLRLAAERRDRFYPTRLTEESASTGNTPGISDRVRRCWRSRETGQAEFRRFLDGQEVRSRAGRFRVPQELDLGGRRIIRSEEHTSELQSHLNLVCRLLLEKKK